jgi:hypothetical protein
MGWLQAKSQALMCFFVGSGIQGANDDSASL